MCAARPRLPRLPTLASLAHTRLARTACRRARTRPRWSQRGARAGHPGRASVQTHAHTHAGQSPVLGHGQAVRVSWGPARMRRAHPADETRPRDRECEARRRCRRTPPGGQTRCVLTPCAAAGQQVRRAEDGHGCLGLRLVWAGHGDGGHGDVQRSPLPGRRDDEDDGGNGDDGDDGRTQRCGLRRTMQQSPGVYVLLVVYYIRYVWFIPYDHGGLLPLWAGGGIDADRALPGDLARVGRSRPLGRLSWALMMMVIIGPTVS